MNEGWNNNVCMTRIYLTLVLLDDAVIEDSFKRTVDLAYDFDCFWYTKR